MFSSLQLIFITSSGPTLTVTCLSCVGGCRTGHSSTGGVSWSGAEGRNLDMLAMLVLLKPRYGWLAEMQMHSGSSSIFCHNIQIYRYKQSYGFDYRALKQHSFTTFYVFPAFCRRSEMFQIGVSVRARNNSQSSTTKKLSEFNPDLVEKTKYLLASD